MTFNLVLLRRKHVYFLGGGGGQRCTERIFWNHLCEAIYWTILINKFSAEITLTGLHAVIYVQGGFKSYTDVLGIKMSG